MVGHPVEDDPQAAPVRLGEQPVEGVEVAEDRIDVGVVADVVAEIGHRRAVDRRQPDGVDTQLRDVVEPRA